VAGVSLFFDDDDDMLYCSLSRKNPSSALPNGVDARPLPLGGWVPTTAKPRNL
jgi:hypothetical protein